MIISRSKQFIFVHNPKAAGTSIQKALQQYDDAKRLKKHTKHETITGLRGRTKLKLSTFFIFGFVRNPWDRFASLFYFMKQHPTTFPQIKKVNNVNHFAECIGKGWLKKRYSIRPQWKYFDDTVFIGRYEHLQRDFKIITTQIGIDAKLPHVNKSKNADYTTLYTPKGKEIIQQRYAVDIEKYEYEFGS